MVFVFRKVLPWGFWSRWENCEKWGLGACPGVGGGPQFRVIRRGVRAGGLAESVL